MSDYIAEPEERKARKKHRCEGCWSMIQVGMSYAILGGSFDGSWISHKFCVPCASLIKEFYRLEPMDDELAWVEIPNYMKDTQWAT